MFAAFTRAFRPGPAQQAAVHPRDHRAVPPRVDGADAGCELPPSRVPETRDPTGDATPASSTSRTPSAAAPSAAVRLRARHHAVHHGEHHRAAAHRGHPSVRGPEEGGSGRARKMTQYTRYLTIGLAVLQSATLVTFAQNPQSLFGPCTNILTDDSIATIVIMVLTMTAGTGLIMWLGELVTDRASATACRCSSSCPSRPRSRRPSGRSRTGGPLGHLPRHHRPRDVRHRRSWSTSSSRSAASWSSTPSGWGPPHVRRHLDLHPAEGQHGQRHPGHLCRLLMALPTLAQFNTGPDPDAAGVGADPEQPRHR